MRDHRRLLSRCAHFQSHSAAQSWYESSRRAAVSVPLGAQTLGHHAHWSTGPRVLGLTGPSIVPPLKGGSVCRPRRGDVTGSELRMSRTREERWDDACPSLIPRPRGHTCNSHRNAARDTSWREGSFLPLFALNFNVDVELLILDEQTETGTL